MSIINKNKIWKMIKTNNHLYKKDYIQQIISLIKLTQLREINNKLTKIKKIKDNNLMRIKMIKIKNSILQEI